MSINDCIIAHGGTCYSSAVMAVISTIGTKLSGDLPPLNYQYSLRCNPAVDSDDWDQSVTQRATAATLDVRK